MRKFKAGGEQDFCHFVPFGHLHLADRKMNFAWINIFGLIAAFAGAALLYFFVPSAMMIDAEGNVTPVSDEKYERDRNWAKIGILLVALGFLAQLMAAVGTFPSANPSPPTNSKATSLAPYAGPGEFGRYTVNPSRPR